MRRAVLAVALLWAVPARAASTKTTPSPGITHIHRWDWSVRGALQDYHVILAEVGNPALRFGVSREADRNHTVSWFGPTYKALVVVNGSQFNFTEHQPCGASQSEGTFWKGPWSGCSASLGLSATKAVIGDNGGTITGPWPAALSFATDGLSGNPWLIRDGKSTAPWTTPASINSRNARTAVGLTATGKTLIMLVVDAGRTNAQGMTGVDLVTVFTEFAAQQALYLDGTAASALWSGKEGGLQNVPADAGREQAVANALMILPPVVVSPMDAATEAMVDSTAAMDTSVEDVAFEAGSGPEDPTGDAGESADGTITDGVPTGLGGSTADDASCRYGSRGGGAWQIVLAALSLLRTSAKTLAARV